MILQRREGEQSEHAQERNFPSKASDTVPLRICQNTQVYYLILTEGQISYVKHSKKNPPTSLPEMEFLISIFKAREEYGFL
jgi:hypothetical protein